MDNLADNINGHIHCDVHGFYTKYFENSTWTSAVERYMNTSDRRSLKSADEAHAWLATIETLYPLSSGSWNVNQPRPVGASAGAPFPDLYLSSSKPIESDKSQWSSVLVVGDFGNTCSETYSNQFLRLCQHALKVFESQPIRLFLHGFLVYDSHVEPWLFDRSGVYCGKSFNMQQDPDRLKMMLFSYSLMSFSELGINTFVKEDTEGTYIVASEHDTDSQERLELEERPITSSAELVGDAVSVYRAKRASAQHWQLAVKFKWILSEQGPVRWPGEGKMLELVKERDVWAVVKPFNRFDLENTSNLRKDLQFGVPRRLSHMEVQASSNEVKSQDQDEKASELSPSNIVAITEPEKESTPKFQERTLECTILTPLGRPLTSFESVLELLEAMRDAVRGHRDLHRKGIIHQDISVWNVMFTDSRESVDYPKGFLIDLDLAVEFKDVLPDGRTCAGTSLFMAVEVLKFKRHTYRHDLESFLYVLLYMSICGRTDELLENSLLQRWREQSQDQLAAAKIQDMHNEEFEHILLEFNTDFEGVKPLARKLHRVLFRTEDPGDGSLWIGTDESAGAIEDMYDAFENAFNEAIVCHRSQQ